MSRKYVNNRWCVRCGRSDPTPYLRKNVDLLLDGRKVCTVVDVGCGNCRNSRFMAKKDCLVCSLDMVDDDNPMILGKDRFPLQDNSIDIVLANYIFMFLDKAEREQVLSEIKRVAGPECVIMVEMYAAKDSHATTKEDCLAMQKDIFDSLGWEKVRYSQERFIARKS